MSVQIL